MKKKKNQPNDVISISHRSYVSLNGYTWECLCAWKCSRAFCYAFFIPYL